MMKNVIIAHTYPKRTGPLAMRTYLENVNEGTMPEATIPAMLPIRRIEPPVPSVSATNDQRCGSEADTIFIMRPVRGTLSITEEARPSIAVLI